MKLLTQQSLIKFDRQFPIYNFFFPSQGKALSTESLSVIMEEAQNYSAARALYFHVPFCDTICSFCPFTRGKYSSREAIDSYFEALLQEIHLKAQLVDLKKVPINAIFFGGGTPSLLDPAQIRRIGNAIATHFDLSYLREFSFEIEVKSLTKERAEAMRDIGVTHPRFGLQTFSTRWRELFDLTATLEQIYDAVRLLKEFFPYQTFDILYGMSGQDEEEIVADLQAATALGTTNIDIYPIDNIMTQVGLHKKLVSSNFSPTSATRKFSMNILVDQFMRHAGFMPHNGHGYVRCSQSDEVVTNKYSFVYHEHVYGYHNYDLLGFGTNAVSSTKGHVVTNAGSRQLYQESISKGQIPCSISGHDVSLDYARPVILRLPYHGSIRKNLVHWDRVPKDVTERLSLLVEEGLVEEKSDAFLITKLGWFWYTNMMYFLMPREDQMVLNRTVVDQLKNPGRSFVKRELLYPSEIRSDVAA